RLVQFTTELGDLRYKTGRRGLARADNWRITTLRLLRLAASRFSRFAACSGAPSHRPPKAQDYAIMADYIRDLRTPEMGFNDKFAVLVRFGRLHLHAQQ